MSEYHGDEDWLAAENELTKRKYDEETDEAENDE